MQQEWRYVYQVYLDGSISKAAEHLYITQPALTLAIQKIESSIGMAILDRSTRPISLTPAGEVYVETAKEALYLEQDLEKQLEDLRTLNSGTLCIGGSHYLNSYILPDVLTGFTRKYPGIQIQLVENSSAALADMLSERQLDLTFNCNPKFLMNFKRHPAFLDHVILAVPAEDPINERLRQYVLTGEDIAGLKHLHQDTPGVSLRAFQDQKFLLLSPGNNLYERSMEMFQEAGFEPKVLMKISQLVTAYHLAQHSLAATFVCDRLISPEDTSLCFYKIDSALTERLFYILLPQRKYTPFPVRAFIQYFAETSIGKSVSQPIH